MPSRHGRSRRSHGRWTDGQHVNSPLHAGEDWGSAEPQQGWATPGSRQLWIRWPGTVMLKRKAPVKLWKNVLVPVCTKAPQFRTWPCTDEEQEGASVTEASVAAARGWRHEKKQKRTEGSFCLPSPDHPPPPPQSPRVLSPAPLPLKAMECHCHSA